MSKISKNDKIRLDALNLARLETNKHELNEDMIDSILRLVLKCLLNNEEGTTQDILSDSLSIMRLVLNEYESIDPEFKAYLENTINDKVAGILDDLLESNKKRRCCVIF